MCCWREMWFWIYRQLGRVNITFTIIRQFFFGMGALSMLMLVVCSFMVTGTDGFRLAHISIIAGMTSLAFVGMGAMLPFPPVDESPPVYPSVRRRRPISPSGVFEEVRTEQPLRRSPARAPPKAEFRSSPFFDISPGSQGETYQSEESTERPEVVPRETDDFQGISFAVEADVHISASRTDLAEAEPPRRPSTHSEGSEATLSADSPDSGVSEATARSEAEKKTVSGPVTRSRALSQQHICFDRIEVESSPRTTSEDRLLRQRRQVPDQSAVSKPAPSVKPKRHKRH